MSHETVGNTTFSLSHCQQNTAFIFFCTLATYSIVSSAMKALAIYTVSVCEELLEQF